MAIPSFKNIIYVLLVFLSLGNRLAVAQEFIYPHTHYGIEDAMSSNKVSCLFQDKKGYIWMGTEMGLNKYDAITFENYYNDPLDSTTITNNYIYCVEEDSEGMIWVGTKNGLNKYDPYTETFQQFFLKDRRAKEPIYGLFFDNGYLWANGGDMLFSIRISDYSIDVHPYNNSKEKEKLEYDSGFPIIGTSSSLWIASPDGLYCYDILSKQMKHFVHDETNPYSISSNYVSSLIKLSENQILVGTKQGLASLEVLSGFFTEGISKNINRLLKEKVSLSITDMLLDKNNSQKKLMISTDDGILVYCLKDESYSIIKHVQGNNKSLGENKVTSLLLDKTNNYWYGLKNKGVDKYAPNILLFRNYYEKGLFDSFPLRNSVTALWTDDKEFWIGHGKKGIKIFDKSDNTSRIINKETKNGLVDNKVHCISEIDSTQLWIGTEKGISIYEKERKQFVDFTQYYAISLPYFLKETPIYNIQKFNSEIFICSQKGLSFFNLETRRFEEIHALDQIIDPVYKVLETKKGFWVASGNGLFLLNKDKEIISTYRPPNELYYKPEIKNRYPLSRVINDIIETESGDLLLATDIGINKMDLETSSFYYLGQGYFEYHETYNFLQKADDSYWVTTDMGLVLFNNQTDSIIYYDEGVGGTYLGYRRGAVFKTPSDDFYFASNKCIISYSVKENHENQSIQKPRLELIDYSINNSEGGLTKHLYRGEKEIKLSYKNNFIRINNLCFDYTNPNSNNYYFLLDNYQRWVKSGSRISISDLSVGKHKVKLKASNSFNIFSDIIEITLVVEPPFYRTWWAYSLYFILFLSFLYWVRNITERNRRKLNRRVQKEKLLNIKLEQQTKELSSKNQDVLDSINFAFYIQRAILPPSNLIKTLFPESFVYYKPKDIVSGDFYWVARRNNKTYIAAIDCTGHGVPGAFLSIIGYNLLKNIIREREIEEVDEILNQLNYGVSEIFNSNQYEKNEASFSGMDISICMVDSINRTLHFSGAKNGIFLVRENSVKTLKANRFSIGSFTEQENKRFDQTVVDYKQGDCIYLFSDGYPDQFGGVSDRKFGYKRFSKMLLNISHLNMSQQKKEINLNFQNWLGHKEQIDDVLVMGVRL